MILWLLACDSVDDPVLLLEGDPAAGEEFWSAECALCHGIDAEGTPRGGPLQDIFERRTESEVLTTIRDGIATMPAYGTRSDQELADLLAFMRTL